MSKMNRLGGKRLELVCILCNETLADIEKACTGIAYNKNDGRSTIGADTASSETAVGEPGAGGIFRIPTPHYGGYHPVTNEGNKDVVATKCGHMFHQGCLRKHVHKTLVEGKGGSLFCPVCTRPFAMNRLWPVIIPPTRSQRERYLQLKMMKEQNADMVKQLKDIRTKIAEEESHLQKIKDESEICLQDIQQKQKLLDAVNGPTNKEMVELTKMHMKRQEILHVVTQHNADLLKLLADESNISTSTAEQLFNVNNSNIYQSVSNQNFLNYKSLLSSSQHNGVHVQFENTSEMYLPGGKKCGKKLKGNGGSNKKSCDKSKKKSSRNKKSKKSLLDYRELESRNDSHHQFFQNNNMSLPPLPNPSEDVIRSRRQHPLMINAATKEYPLLRNNNNRPVDTVMKWNMESVRRMMSLDNLSESSSINGVPINRERQGDNVNRHYDEEEYHTPYGDHDPSGGGGGAMPILTFPSKNSTKILLSRKAPIILNKNIIDVRKVKK